VQKHELYDITKYLNVQLTDRSVRYINLLPRFREVEDGKFLFFDNSHPTELGHKIIAEEILKVLISDDLL